MRRALFQLSYVGVKRERPRAGRVASSPWPESNRRPTAYQAIALPTELHGHYWRPGSNRRPAAYKAAALPAELRQHGAEARNRTGDLLFTKQPLFQLSYIGVCARAAGM